jgi:hypothetical protein
VGSLSFALTLREVGRSVFRKFRTVLEEVVYLLLLSNIRSFEPAFP